MLEILDNCAIIWTFNVLPSSQTRKSSPNFMEVSAILLQQSLSYFLIKRGSLMLMNTHIALKGTLLRGPYLYYYWCYWPLANIENKTKIYSIFFNQNVDEENWFAAVKKIMLKNQHFPNFQFQYRIYTIFFWVNV